MKLTSVDQHKVSKSFTSWRKWSWRCQQESSRRSQGMRWCWIQGRGQRALRGRQRSPQDPFWCFAQTLARFQIYFTKKILLTHNSALAKENVDNSNVLLPSVVELILEWNKRQTFCSSKFYRWLGDKQLVLVPSPHRGGQGWDVGGKWAARSFVSLFHLEWDLKIIRYKKWSLFTLSVHRAGSDPAFNMQRGFRFRFRESHFLKRPSIISRRPKTVATLTWGWWWWQNTASPSDHSREGSRSPIPLCCSFASRILGPCLHWGKVSTQY